MAASAPTVSNAYSHSDATHTASPAERAIVDLYETYNALPAEKRADEESLRQLFSKHVAPACVLHTGIGVLTGIEALVQFQKSYAVFPDLTFNIKISGSGKVNLPQEYIPSLGVCDVRCL